MREPDYSKMTWRELIQQEGNFRPETSHGSGPRAELEKRRFKRALLTQGIPAWLALAVSIIALIVSIANER